MRDPRRRITAAAIDQPFIADRLVALDQPPEEALHRWIGVDDRIEVLGLADHDFGSDDRLDSILRRSVARQDTFAWKTQCYDLPPAGCIGLKLRKDARAHEHDFVARGAGIAERPPRFHLDDSMRHLVE